MKVLSNDILSMFFFSILEMDNLWLTYGTLSYAVAILKYFG